jgi:hypothetical protein
MLAEILRDTQRGTRQGLPCPIAVILDEIPENDRTALTAEMDRPIGDPKRLSNAVIARALTDSGHPIHQKGVERHRNKVCRCFSGRL